MSGYRELMRRKLLEEMYDNLSPEEKRTFIQLTMQDKSNTEIMQALNELKAKADKNHHSFALDLGANVAGNAIWDTLIWAGTKLLKLK